MQRALLTAPSWVLPGASADLDFVHARAWAGGSTSLASLLSTSRASGGMAQFANGSWASFPANAPRITDQGLLIEQASTNSVRNNSMMGAVAGTPGTAPTHWIVEYNDSGAGLTTTIVGTGTEFGLPYIDLNVSGTPTSSGDGLIAIADAATASSGQTWTGSWFARLISGSFTATSSIFTQSVNGATIYDNVSSNAVTTATLQQFQQALTLVNASANAVRCGYLINTAKSVAINVTVRLYAPQLEQLGFATSPILTTSASVTRAGETIALTGAAQPAALVAKAARFATDFGTYSNQNALLLYSGVGQVFRFGSATTVLSGNGSNGAIATIGGSGTISGSVKSAFGVDGVSFTAIANGGTKVISGNAWGSLVSPVYLGSNPGNNQLDGYLLRTTLGPIKGQFDNMTTGGGE